eukprot:1429754-Rhodomonas_salina.1
MPHVLDESDLREPGQQQVAQELRLSIAWVVGRPCEEERLHRGLRWHLFVPHERAGEDRKARRTAWRRSRVASQYFVGRRVTDGPVSTVNGSFTKRLSAVHRCTYFLLYRNTKYNENEYRAVRCGP